MTAELEPSAVANPPELTSGADGLAMARSPGPARRPEGSRGGAGSRCEPLGRPPKPAPASEPGRGLAGDRGGTLPAYGAGAASYEQRTDTFTVFRRRLVEALVLRRGDVVLDVGCGTGLCLPLLREKVGAEGVVLAVDESVAMLDIARARAERACWSNVTFIQARAAEVVLPVEADAALFCAVHDIVRCPESVANIVSQLRPGAHVVSGGGKWAASWLVLLNAYVAALHRPFVRSFDGFDRPWTLLTARLRDVTITEMQAGTGYLAMARVPD